ncbi:MAG TPA: hypothetical protein VFV87_16200, partial [Pirellulaceae bacterium]|nr:hypothetical protein [Pirellulaceae bacterium]
MARTCGQCGLVLAALGVCAAASGQTTIQFPRTSTPPATTTTTAPGIITAPAPGATTTVNPYTGGSFNPGPFDPYSTNGASAYQFWSNTPPSNTMGVFAQPPPGSLGTTSPLVTQPPVASPYGPPATAPYTPGAPQFVFPNGMGQPWDLQQSVRLIQDLRMRYTWVEGGDDPTDLDINDIETAVSFTWPAFLWTNQPLFISPAFALHLWDGPKGISADLPSKAYSAYLDL